MNIENLQTEDLALVPSVRPLLVDLKIRGEKALIEWCKEGKSETLHLEFKKKKTREKPELERDDKQNLGRLISAFSNSDGGLLVWGIHTKKVEEIDVAAETRSVSGVESFANHVASQCLSSLSPENERIKFFTIRSEEDSSKGYLLVLVPKGNQRPYMSTAPDDRRYYRKTAKGTNALEHYEVIDIIRAADSPTFGISWTVSHSSTGNNARGLHLHLLVRNTGSIAAERPYLWIDNTSDLVPHANSGFSNKKDTTGIDNKYKFYSQSDYVLMPDDTEEFCFFKIHIPHGQIGDICCYWGGDSSLLAHSARRKLDDVSLNVLIGAKNGHQQLIKVVLSAVEIETKAFEVAKIVK